MGTTKKYVFFSDLKILQKVILEKVRPTLKLGEQFFRTTQ